MMNSFLQKVFFLSLVALIGLALGLPAERSSLQQASPASGGNFELMEDEGNPSGGERGPENLEWLLSSGLGHRAQKRRFGLSDPRSLFANIYGNYGNYVGYRKRLNIPSQSEVSSYYYGPTSLALASRKRGLGDRYDPRNLFRAIYGYKK